VRWDPSSAAKSLKRKGLLLKCPLRMCNYTCSSQQELDEHVVGSHDKRCKAAQEAKSRLQRLAPAVLGAAAGAEGAPVGAGSAAPSAAEASYPQSSVPNRPHAALATESLQGVADDAGSQDTVPGSPAAANAGPLNTAGGKSSPSGNFSGGAIQPGPPHSTSGGSTPAGVRDRAEAAPAATPREATATGAGSQSGAGAGAVVIAVESDDSDAELLAACRAAEAKISASVANLRRPNEPACSPAAAQRDFAPADADVDAMLEMEELAMEEERAMQDEVAARAEMEEQASRAATAAARVGLPAAAPVGLPAAAHVGLPAAAPVGLPLGFMSSAFGGAPIAPAPVAQSQTAAFPFGGPGAAVGGESFSVTSGGGCFKCGLPGHWAKDCPCQCGFRCRWPGQPCQAATVGAGNVIAGGGIGSAPTATAFGGIAASSGTIGGGSSTTVGASDGRDCLKCGQAGHWVRDCPCQCGYRCKWKGIGPCQTALGSSTSGGQVGSTTGGLFGTPGGLFGGISGSTERPCYKCGQVGHWASACGQGGGEARSGGAGGCFRCGQTGHWASDCPTRV